MPSKPVFRLPRTGSDPKVTSAEELEAGINASTDALHANDVTEQTARIVADTAETAARIAADTAETTARIAADNAEADLRVAGDAATTAALLDASQDLRRSGVWAATGAFPSGASAGDLFTVITAGTVDGETFAQFDQLLALVDAPSTTTYDGNWLRDDRESLLARLGLMRFSTTNAMRVSTLLTVGQVAQTPSGDFLIVAAGTYTANADTVIDLTGIAGQAVSTRLHHHNITKFFADTRPLAFFQSIYGTSDTLRITAEDGATYHLDLTGAGPADVTNAIGCAFEVLQRGQGIFARDFGMKRHSLLDQGVAWRAAVAKGVSLGVPTFAPNGVSLVGSAGAAFADDFSKAADEACTKVGSRTIDDSIRCWIGVEGGSGTLKPFVQNGVASIIVCENIGEFVLMDGLDLDGNCDTGTGTIANAMVIAGVERVTLPKVLRVFNCQNIRICGSRERRGGIVHLFNIIGWNLFGSTLALIGKPFGVREVHHTGTISLSGLDANGATGAATGVLTLDNDPVQTDMDDYTVSGITWVGRDVTVTRAAHGKSIGDWVFVDKCTTQAVNGQHQITAVTTDTFEYTAHQDLGTSPGTAEAGGFLLRPCFGPIEVFNIDTVIGTDMATDAQLRIVKLEEGCKSGHINRIVARDLNEVTASTSISALLFAPGTGHTVTESVTVGVIEAQRCFAAYEHVQGRAPCRHIGIGKIITDDVGIAVKVSAKDGIDDHAMVDHMSVNIEGRGEWPGNNKGYAVEVGNDGSRVDLINVLDAEIPAWLEGGDGVCAILGVRKVNMSVGTVAGGFATPDSDPLSNAQDFGLTGCFVFADVADLNLHLDDVDAGGANQGGGVAGNGIEYHVTNSATITGRLSCGTGGNQRSGAAVRMALPTTVNLHTTLAKVRIGLDITNAPIGIVMDNPAPGGGQTALASDIGYDVELRDCAFADVTDPVESPTRFAGFNVYDCRGLYQASGSAETPTTIAAHESWIGTSLNIPGIIPGDLVTVRYDGQADGALAVGSVVGVGNNVSPVLLNLKGSTAAPGAGRFHVDVQPRRAVVAA